jgi:peptide/nickel transport system ATP-binding protein
VAAARSALDGVVASPCRQTDPELSAVGPDHEVACLLYDDAHPDAPERTE